MNFYLITGLIYLLWFILSWFLGSWLKLQGSELWILRAALWLLGLVAAGVVVWYLRRRRQLGQLDQSEAAPAAELQFLFRAAERQLASSTKLRAGARRIAELPAAVFVGAPGSAKTYLILNSGAEPELLAGHVYQDSSVAPTRSANVWLASGWILAEAGGPLLASNALLQRLLRAMRGGTIRTLLSGRKQAPRAIVVAIDIDSCARLDAGALTAQGRRLNEVLSNAAVVWGSRVPVYVLFTKLDQIPYFTDFVRNFDDREASQVVGITLPEERGVVSGVWTERETYRLSMAFDQIFRGFADKRLDQLQREMGTAKSPNIYEFPREFRKLRESVVRILLEISRPSQLRATPFLRGLYFTGVRPVQVDDRGHNANPLPVESVPFNPEATRIFSAPLPGPAARPMESAAAGGRVPQWIFLNHFFAYVLMADRSAMGTSAASPRVALIRRVLLSVLAAAGCIYVAGLTISYFNNRSFIKNAEATKAALAATRVATPAVPTTDDLKRLDQLREAALNVTRYHRSGAPFFQRWGVYPGQDLHDRVRSAYCSEFRRFLFNDAQGAVATSLSRLGPAAGYDTTYDSLKAYLMTTSFASKADGPFLEKVLAAQWGAQRNASPEMAALAREQFRFYGSQRSGGYCDSIEDKGLVLQAQKYLKDFPVFDRVYATMISDLSTRFPPVTFSDPAGAVVDEYRVPGAYTKPGWEAMQNSTLLASEYLSRESWVLGAEQGTPSLSPAELAGRLRALYQAKYREEWDKFLAAGRVPGYGALKNAAVKLKRIAEAQSPLLQVFCLVSINTNVDSSEVKKEFEGIQKMESPDTCASKPADAPNLEYMKSLNNLQIAVEKASQAPVDDVSLSESAPARLAAGTLAQTFNLSRPAQTLLEAPIINADNLVREQLPKDLNGKGGGFCKDLDALLMSKFPFRSRATAQAQIDDLNSVFQAGTGRIASFYEETLKAVLIPQGGHFAASSMSKVPVNEGFVRYFNKLADIKTTLYPANATSPTFTYVIKAEPSPDVESFTLRAEGRALTGSGRGGEAAEFAWTGSGASASLEAKAKGQSIPSNPVSGTWAIFALLGQAPRSNRMGNATLLEFDLYPASLAPTNQQQKLGVLRLSVQIKGPAPLFAPGYLSESCNGRIAAPH